MNKETSSSDFEVASVLASEIRTTFGKLKRRMHDHGLKSDLTSSQVSVLLRLERDGSAAVSTLARAEGMRPQSMSSTIAPLQKAGLVKGAPDPGDGRQTLMSLTPKCVKRLKEGRAARQDWLITALSERLSSPEQRKVRAAFALLARVVED